MGKVKKWVKGKITNIMIATSSVEESLLKQSGGDVGNNTGHIQKHNQGSLADDLINGNLTQQVKDLRYKTYKIIEESQNYRAIYNDDGTLTTVKIGEDDYKERLKLIKLDNYDNYPLELVVNNIKYSIGVNDVFDNITKTITEDGGGFNEVPVGSEYNEVPVDFNNGSGETNTLGVIKASTLNANIKEVFTIKCKREFRCKFEIERFTKKMNVRSIDDKVKLLELCVSRYPNGVTEKLFISDIKRAIKNPRTSDFLNINEVNFISRKTLGVKDLHEFKYNDIKFDKIVEFNGYYIIKFIANVIVNGESVYGKFNEEIIEEKYKNKEKKDGNTYNII